MKTYQVTVTPDCTVWRFDGELHCEDGPACEYADGTKGWYINSEELTEEQFNSRHVKELSIDELEKILGHKVKIVKK